MDKNTILERLKDLKEDTARISDFIEEDCWEIYLNGCVDLSCDFYHVVYDAEMDELQVSTNKYTNNQEHKYHLVSFTTDLELNDRDYLIKNDVIYNLEDEQQSVLLNYYKRKYHKQDTSITDMLNDTNIDIDSLLVKCLPNDYFTLLNDYIVSCWEQNKSKWLQENIIASIEEHIKTL